MRGELQEAVARLQRQPLDAAVFRGVTVTGTGFFGPERAAIRELAYLCGLAYSGDLVNGSTTHLVLAPEGATAGTPAGGTRKLQKAAEWGIPCVRLAWLLDSIAAGQVRQVQPYLLYCGAATAVGTRQECAASAPPPPAAQQQAAAQASCQQLPVRHRPSSVASNAPTATVPSPIDSTHGQQPAAAASAACGGDGELPPQQQQQHPHRAALAPVDNLLADQLRRMSISPEPPLADLEKEQHPQASPQQAATAAQWPADSPPQQRSPSGSPQYSLSLQGMVGAASQSADGSPAEVASARPAAVAGQRQQESQSPGSEHEPMQQDAEQPAGFSPMQQQSPAAWQPPGEQQQQTAGSCGNGIGAGGGRHEAPFTFSLAAALGRSISDEMGGSPMAESPVAAPLAAAAGSSGGGTGSHARSRLAGTPAAGNEDEPLCTLPTPACIRDWSDDDSMPPSSAAAAAAAQAAYDGSPALGITQTPPAIRQALAAGNEPTQYAPPPRPQQQHQEQQQDDVGGVMQQTPAAVRDWSDDETVASEPGEAGELIISDSEAEEADVAPAPRQHAPPSQQQHAPVADATAQAALKQQQPREQQEAPQLHRPLPSQQQQQHQPRRLRQVSRASVGQPAIANARRSVPPQPNRPAAVSTIKQAAAEPQPAYGDEPMPSPGGSWQPEHPGSCSRSGGSGSKGSVSPTGAAARLVAATSPDSLLAGAGGDGGVAAAHLAAAPQQRPSTSSSAGPAVDEHFITSRRQGASKQQQQQRSVKDWSDDDSDDFPSPKGNRTAGGLTGLTQLDPASIVIARPKPSASTANWRGDGSSQGGVQGMKFLQRPPRGNAVRERHGLANLKAVQFAEQVQVSAAGLILSTKDKKTAVRLQPGSLTEEEAEDDDFRADSGRRGSSSSAGGSQAGRQQQDRQQQLLLQKQEEPMLAEPQTFYRLPDGSWWLECCRVYTAAQAEAAAAEQGHVVQLPPGFDRDCELLKAVAREHAPMCDVAGGVQIRRVKQGGTMLRFRGGTANSSRSYFWRLAVDTHTWKVVTDRPSADFVAIE